MSFRTAGEPKMIESTHAKLLKEPFDTHFRFVKETPKKLFWKCTHGGWTLTTDHDGGNLYIPFTKSHLEGKLECEEA